MNILIWVIATALATVGIRAFNAAGEALGEGAVFAGVLLWLMGSIFFGVAVGLAQLALS